MKWALILVGIITIGTPKNLYAQSQGMVFEDGNKMLSKCSQNDPSYQIYCLGFIVAISDIMIKDPPIFGFQACLPDVTARQLKDVFLRELQRNPQTRHLSAVSLAASALASAFPCR